MPRARFWDGVGAARLYEVVTGGLTPGNLFVAVVDRGTVVLTPTRAVAVRVQEVARAKKAELKHKEMAAFLAKSQETHNAFVQQLFHYLVKQPIRAFSRTELTDLRGAFASRGYNIRELMVEIMTSSALASRGSDVAKR